jgi:hypothetical protein
MASIRPGSLCTVTRSPSLELLCAANVGVGRVIIDSFAAADYRALCNEKRIQAVLLGVKGVGGNRWLGRWDVAYTTTQRPDIRVLQVISR